MDLEYICKQNSRLKPIVRFCWISFVLSYIDLYVLLKKSLKCQDGQGKFWYTNPYPADS